MMYPVPDVYWQAVFPTSEPVFLTGVPVFLGYTQNGPINEPQLLHLWPQFEAAYGAPFAEGYLYYAVRGFFENGGLVAYVVRLDDAVPLLTGLREGLTAVTTLDSVDLICAPDIVHQTDVSELDAVVAAQQEILNHCQLLGDRFAILDALLTTDYNTILAQGRQLNSRYGALYAAWVWVSGAQSGTICIPASGHLAGIYARSDQNVGVHQAPANQVLAGVLDLNTHLTVTQQADLYAHNINYLRSFTGRGIRVWGARTLSREPEWQHINVRRLFLAIGRWLERYMTASPFEPNTPRLWVRLMRDVTAYLNGLFLQGALKGETADQAFYVKCDGETNPLEVREAGMVVMEMGLATAVPAEFIEVRIVHGSSGVSVTA